MPDWPECDRPHCEAPARWKVYAAYEAEQDSAHPRVARHTEPLARTCGMHLPLTLGRDAANHDSTQMWVVQPL
jgi:hypothetical protein